MNSHIMDLAVWIVFLWFLRNVISVLVQICRL